MVHIAENTAVARSRHCPAPSSANARLMIHAAESSSSTDCDNESNESDVSDMMELLKIIVDFEFK